MRSDSKTGNADAEYPWWLPCFTAFIAGVAVTAAALTPAITTPDFQRGRADGYQQGLDDRGSFYGKVNYDQGFADGVKHSQSE